MRLAFDIGGTHMRVARIEGRAVSGTLRAATPPSAQEGFDTLISLSDRIAQAEHIDGIVGGIAGVVREDGSIAASPNLPGWEGFPLAERLSNRFQATAHVINDAMCAALGEAHVGAGRGFPIVGYMVIGTGVGGARVVNGKVDAHVFGFEPGHQVIDVERSATLESLVGGAALRKRYGVRAEALGRGVFDELTPVLAGGVWNAIAHWSPDVLVLGGGLMNEDTAFRIQDVRREVEKLRRVVPALPEIRLAALGDDSGLVGAAIVLSEN